jgi:hypothetical protein
VNLPSDVSTVLAEAKRAYQRFAEHYDSIQRIRVRLEREPLDEQALSALCQQVGIPSDFDVMQFCWKPAYDPYYYQQLKRRSRNVYSFRGEYLFQLPLAMVGEIPQLGNATYVFAKPPDVREFVRAYAATSRDDRAVVPAQPARRRCVKGFWHSSGTVGGKNGAGFGSRRPGKFFVFRGVLEPPAGIEPATC